MTVQEMQKKYGLVRPYMPPQRRIIMGIQADTGCGKSDLVYRTAPRPLLHLNLDMNVEGISERHIGEEIYMMNVHMPEMIVQDEDFKSFLAVRDCVIDGINSGFFRTVFVDTGDALWELCRRGFIGKLEFGAGPRQDYAQPNGAMRRMFRAAKNQHKCNLIVAHRAKDEREKGINPETQKETSILTGDQTMAGWVHTKYELQVQVELTKEAKYTCPHRKNQCTNPEACRLNRFKAEIVKCTANEKAEHEVFLGRDITFARIAMAVYPMTEDTPEVWA